MMDVSIGQAGARIINIDGTEVLCGRFEQLQVATKLYPKSTSCDVTLKYCGLSSPEGSLAQSVVSEGKQPQFAVLTAEGRRWVRLIRPLKSYEEMIRTVLITAQMLHFLRRKPHEPEKTLWNHLCKVFKYIPWHTLLRLFFWQMFNTDAYRSDLCFCSKFDVRPSEDDFRNHRSLMKQFATKDPVLAKSKVSVLFLLSKFSIVFVSIAQLCLP
jgi:hypothetical protein